MSTITTVAERTALKVILSNREMKVPTTTTGVYWHRSLPPIDAEMIADHVIEANSSRVPGTLAHRDQLWNRCYQELMAVAESRIRDEIARLGGDYAHVHGESLGAKHDDVAGEAWLHGAFTCMLYRRPADVGVSVRAHVLQRQL